MQLLSALNLQTVYEHRRLPWNTMFAEWKMNIVVISGDNERMFVAEGSDVVVLGFDGASFPSRFLHRLQAHQHDINFMRLCKVSNEEVLVSLDDGGIVFIHFVHNLLKQPIEFNNHISTWSCHVHPGTGVLAVGANNFRIRLIKLMVDSPAAAGNGASSSSSWNDIDTFRHDHNVPCLEIDPTGRYVVSASIDHTCRIWDIKTLSNVCRRRICNEWGWSAHFVEKSSIRKLDPSDACFVVRRRKRFYSSLLQTLALGRTLFRRGTADEEEDEEDEGESDEDADGIDSTAMVAADGEEEDDASSDAGVSAEVSERANFFDTHVESQLLRDERMVSPPRVRHSSTSSSSSSTSSSSSSSRAASRRKEAEKAATEAAAAAAAAEQEEEENVLDRYVIAYTSMTNVYLLEASDLSELTCVLSPINLTGLWGRMIHRLSLSLYIPELSLLVIASQGAARARILRLVCSNDTVERPRYRMLMENLIPEAEEPQSMLIGMDCRKIFSAERHLGFCELFLLYADGQVFCYEIGVGSPSSAAASASASEDMDNLRV